MWYSKPEWWAVIVAFLLGLWGIFKDAILNLFYKPKLKIELLVQKPDCHKTELNTGAGRFAAYYYRFRITNEGNITAKNIETFIRHKSVINRGRTTTDDNFLPLNLKWAHDGVEVRESIAPGLFKYADFGFIADPNATQFLLSPFGLTATSSIVMSLDLTVLPNTGSSILTPGKYVFEIWVTAQNSSLIKKRFEIDFRDNWNDQENQALRSILTVRQID